MRGVFQDWESPLHEQLLLKSPAICSSVLSPPLVTYNLLFKSTTLSILNYYSLLKGFKNPPLICAKLEVASSIIAGREKELRIRKKAQEPAGLQIFFKKYLETKIRKGHFPYCV